MFDKILIANRGAIAVRILKTLKRLGIASVAVYSEADANSLHVKLADESVCIGAAPVNESYLNGDRILAVAQEVGAQAIHPGYGFLSENPSFSRQCEALGIVFIGPTPDQMDRFSLKHTARAIAQQTGVPLVPGTELLSSLEEAIAAAQMIGYPVMLKSTAGGGGIGMQRCYSEAELTQAFTSIQQLGQRFFKDSGVFLEKYIAQARHIEVQIFGDGQGQVRHLGERDCSTQRRNQKVIEETPAPRLSETIRQSLCDYAVKLGQAVDYRSAGTVEFIFDDATQQFYFLEVNTRLQVEHGVTEEVTGVDLVEWMIRAAAGETQFLTDYQHNPQGASIQLRLYAEDPARNFQPCPGVLTRMEFPTGLRCETWVDRGSEITSFYDPMIAKLIVKGSDRTSALDRLQAELKTCKINGIQSNLDYLIQVLQGPEFAAGTVTTQFLNQFSYQPPTIEVLEPGTYSTIQDYPGRVGYWDIGVPPSGAMDQLAFRWANRLVGNAESAAGFEFTLSGPTLKFNLDTTIALTGAVMTATLDGEAVPYWQAVPVKAGSILKLKSIQGTGCRTYLGIQKGLDVPLYLGSRSTFPLGQFGGETGRILRSGDTIRLAIEENPPYPPVLEALPSSMIPTYQTEWEIGVLYGPHGAPDFFTPADIEMFFSTTWKVHHNSNRLGVRLIGSSPQWARQDGGDAGLHPSNIHDCEYAVGSVNFTGDTPVILTCDGPSLGGFVCPATIVKGELWKVGQVRPGDGIRFCRITFEQALAQEKAQDQMLKDLSWMDWALTLPAISPAGEDDAILCAFSVGE